MISALHCLGHKKVEVKGPQSTPPSIKGPLNRREGQSEPGKRPRLF